MRRKRPLGTILALGALLLPLAACGRPDGPPAAGRGTPGKIKTSDGRTGPPGPGSMLEPRMRYPEGTHLFRFDAEGLGRTLPLDLAVAGGVVPMLDRERILFVGTADVAEKYGIWSCRSDGSDLRRVVGVNADCGGAAELPDGRIVYSREIPGWPAMADLRSRWALYVKAREERDGQRITYGSGLDIDPSVLDDGRILYSSYEPGHGVFLWTVHPDGTGASRVPGAHGGDWPATRAYQTVTGDVCYLLRMKHPMVELRVVDWRAPGLGFRLLSRPDAPELERSRARPQGHLSMVRASVPYGQVVGLDAGEGARAVRFFALEGVKPSRPSRLLGEVPLAEDGSFFVRLPPDVPLVLETLDADGNAIGSQKTPFWVRPNETRACVGCHEDPETAPPNRRPLAVLKDPVDLSSEGGR